MAVAEDCEIFTSDTMLSNEYQGTTFATFFIPKQIGFDFFSSANFVALDETISW
jgi:hypothetical protein